MTNIIQKIIQVRTTNTPQPIKLGQQQGMVVGGKQYSTPQESEQRFAQMHAINEAVGKQQQSII
jgi:hypothetical protein